MLVALLEYFLAFVYTTRHAGRGEAVKRFHLSILLMVAGLLLVVICSNTMAYERYSDGCVFCHGDFTDGTSTKGSVFPNDNKHTMHRSNSYMGADCGLCHSSNDNNDPFIGSSDGTNDNPGIGCTGCHTAEGLRQHHIGADTNCTSTCHVTPSSLPEDTVPTYYGTADVSSDMVDPCNLSGLSDTDENWTVGDLIGIDNDGDGLYDADDPDCATTSASPGEMPLLTVPSHDTAARTFAVSYDATTCEQTSNNVFYGPLSTLSNYTYTGQGCSIGNTGSYAFDYSAIAESIFFVIVAQNGLNEGSYGIDTTGVERPDALLCPESQLLVDRCD
jgi:hypothetical protein